MTVDVTKGASVALTKEGSDLTRVTVGLGWDPAPRGSTEDFDLDASALALGTDGRIVSRDYFVFFNNLSSPRGEIRHRGDNLTGEGAGDDEQIDIQLDELSRAVERVVFAVTIHNADYRGQNFGDIRNAFIRVVDAVRGVELVRYNLTTDAATDTAMLFGELHHDGTGWHFRALGQGRLDGLAGIARQFGFTV
ncbi:TerD family protein [Frankia sp. CNm7]|uniref:TerD family protein n=1 Tax=Frankia nepalensis TaxID=1836974 RepID=A0A937R7D7_9ACTN|nr:TerD family protein [Frankia nepalensis]MBL7500909.1 TerD family protein [Frankia nepalensis]MBL7510338.1 TerD family protein [Frankia nepalensis]MBL7519224.1 TerD family protein [Frankia nepalensis]MBL7626676.1 TerD family protein [Frankia nepalensis]